MDGFPAWYSGYVSENAKNNVMLFGHQEFRNLRKYWGAFLKMGAFLIIIVLISPNQALKA